MESVGVGEDGERRGQITRGPWSPERGGACSPLTGRPPSPAPASLKRGKTRAHEAFTRAPWWLHGELPDRGKESGAEDISGVQADITVPGTGDAAW